MVTNGYLENMRLVLCLPNESNYMYILMKLNTVYCKAITVPHTYLGVHSSGVVGTGMKYHYRTLWNLLYKK